MSNAVQEQHQCKHPVPLDSDLEDFLVDNKTRANVTASVTELIWYVLCNAYEEWREAPMEEKQSARRTFTDEAAKYLPVLEMLTTYTKDSQVHARRIYEYYENNASSTEAAAHVV